MKGLLPILGVLLLALPAGGEDEAVEPFEDRVDAAIERAKAYLLGEQHRDGSWSGEEGPTALALLALHRSGVREGHRRFDRGLRWLLAHRNKFDTYTFSLAVMVLVEADPERYAESIRKLALRIVLGQCTNGQWSYKCQPGRMRKRGDNSNTQFALLALWMAKSAGVAVPRHAWVRAETHWAETQNEDGGWGYSKAQRKNSYGSMTAAGLSSMTVVKAAQARSDAERKAAAEHVSVRRARDWLGTEFAVDKNPKANRDLGGRMRERKGRLIGDSYWRFYYLWSLERAGRLADVERFGDHDWYREGAEALLAEQRDDGRWVGGVSPELGTCFALLFLTRGTKPVTTVPVTGVETTPR